MEKIVEVPEVHTQEIAWRTDTFDGVEYFILNTLCFGNISRSCQRDKEPQSQSRSSTKVRTVPKIEVQEVVLISDGVAM